MLKAMKRAGAGAIVLLAAAGLRGETLAHASAQNAPPPKRAVEFLLQDSVKVGKADMVVVSSGATTKKEVGNCRTGAAPVQNLIVMAADGGASRRVIGGFIPLGDPIVLGTRIVNLTPGEACGPGYRKFRGTTE